MKKIRPDKIKKKHCTQNDANNISALNPYSEFNNERKRTKMQYKKPMLVIHLFLVFLVLMHSNCKLTEATMIFHPFITRS